MEQRTDVANTNREEEEAYKSFVRYAVPLPQSVRQGNTDDYSPLSVHSSSQRRGSSTIISHEHDRSR